MHLGDGCIGKSTEGKTMNEAQIERVREIVQAIATGESFSFDEAFAIAMGHLKYWSDEMPKGRKASGGGTGQSAYSQADQSAD